MSQGPYFSIPNELNFLSLYLLTSCFSKSCRFVKFYFILLLVNQMSSGLFRFIGAMGRNMIVANTFGSFAILLVFALSGFVLVRGTII